MTKAVNLLRIGPALRRINLERVQVRAAAAGKEMAGRMPLKLQVLQVMVVPRHVEIHMVLAEQGIPIANQYWVVSMGAVRVNGMM